MAFTIYVTRDFDQMRKVAADVVEADVREKQAARDEYLLGLATGNSPALAWYCRGGTGRPEHEKMISSIKR